MSNGILDRFAGGMFMKNFTFSAAIPSGFLCQLSPLVSCTGRD